MFVKPSTPDILNLKDVIQVIELILGFQGNLGKFGIIGIIVDDSHLLPLASHLGCVESSPLKYIGLPLGGLLHRSSFWDSVIEKVDKSLASWKSLLRLFSLISLSITCRSFQSRLRCKEIRVASTRFSLRGGNPKKNHLIKWKMCKFKLAGDHRIGNIISRNNSLFGKWI